MRQIPQRAGAVSVSSCEIRGAEITETQRERREEQQQKAEEEEHPLTDDNATVVCHYSDLLLTYERQKIIQNLF